MNEDASVSRRWKRYLIPLVLLGAGLAVWAMGCSSPSDLREEPITIAQGFGHTASQVSLPSATPTIAETPFVLEDCVWIETGGAWIDQDGDGIRAADEPPLSGVDFCVDDTLNEFTCVGRGVSDWHGRPRSGWESRLSFKA
jgi:hypothetical protein